MQVRRSLVVAFLVLALVVGLSGARAAADTIDGLANGQGPIGPGRTLELVVTGRGGVPSSGVGAVALNVTATAPTLASFLTVWPTGSVRPTASNLNFEAGQTIPNMVVVPVGAGGKVSMYNARGSVEVAIDVLGWFPTGAAFTGMNPARLLDTRPGGPTSDGGGSGSGPLPGGSTLTLAVAGRGSIPSSGVGAVALNVTATNATQASFLSVFPAGADRPTASNLNFASRQTIPNMVIVQLGTGGSISIFNAVGATDIVVDVLGWFPATGSMVGLDPARLLDTRPLGPMIDGLGTGNPIGPGASLAVPVLGRGGVPASGVAAVAMNVTLIGPTANTFLTVWPSGSARPNASNLNGEAQRTIANLVVSPLGVDGAVQLYNAAGTTDVAVDVLGYFPTGPVYNGLVPARLLDTRDGSRCIIPSTPGTVAEGRVLLARMRTGPDLGCFQMRRVDDVYGETPNKTGSGGFATFTVDGRTFTCGALSATNSLLTGRASHCDAAGGSGPAFDVIFA